MNISKQIAKHLREIHFGGNWTFSNLNDQLKDVNWRHVTTQVHSFNTIATLVFHMNYFVNTLIHFLENNELIGNDKYSFDHPPIHSEEDWNKMMEKTWNDAEKLALLIEQFPEEKLEEYFSEEKYGTYYRNFHGIIEHNHYHIGQIAIIKKLVLEPK
jgi:hypothetical protein